MNISSSTCRICLHEKKRSKLKSLFSKEFEFEGGGNSSAGSEYTITIADSIFQISGIQIDLQSELPTKVCSKCLESLRIAWTIRQKCIESDVYLKRMLEDKDSSVQVKLEPQEEGIDTKSDDNETDPQEPNLTNFSMKMEVHSENEGEVAFDFVNFDSEPPPAKKHKKKKKKHSYDDYEKLIPGTKLRDEPKIKDTFQCSVCGKILMSGGALASHEKSHIRAMIPKEKRTYICDYCGKQFLHKTYIYVHLFSIHVEHHNGYKCEICNKYFYKKVFYTGHVNTHKNIRSFQCQLCPKAFAKKINLNVHMRVHTGEKPYECQYCEKSYAHHSDRKRHIMMAHTGERPYVCKICGKGYVKKSCLTAHEKTHGITTYTPILN